MIIASEVEEKEQEMLNTIRRELMDSRWFQALGGPIFEA